MHGIKNKKYFIERFKNDEKCKMKNFISHEIPVQI